MSKKEDLDAVLLRPEDFAEYSGVIGEKELREVLERKAKGASMSPDPSLARLCGRYEYTNPAERSDKFWEIHFDSKTGMYRAEWGKRGSPPQGDKTYTGKEALKKIQEKIAKGYVIVQADDFEEAPERAALKKRAEKLKERTDATNFIEELKKL